MDRVLSYRTTKNLSYSPRVVVVKATPALNVGVANRLFFKVELPLKSEFV